MQFQADFLFGAPPIAPPPLLVLAMLIARSLDIAYRSFREVLAGSTPASIRRLQSIVVTQIPA